MKYSSIILLLILSACTGNHKSATKKEHQNETTQEFRVLKEYSKQDLENLDSSQLRIKRNEIFAQYGYKFKSDELHSYFQDQEWYVPKYDKIDTFLTDLDKQNIQLISNYEKQLELSKKRNRFSCEIMHNELPKFTVYSSIQAVVDSIGKPSRTFIHEDISCPIGQLHFWQLHSKNLRIIILGDDYSGKENLNSKSRFYAVQAHNTNKSVNFEFNQIKLGESDEVVKQKLDCLVSMNQEFSLELLSETSFVETFFIEEQSHQYLLSTKDLFIHFVIDSNNKLKTIIFATFNDRLAC